MCVRPFVRSCVLAFLHSFVRAFHAFMPSCVRACHQFPLHYLYTPFFLTSHPLHVFECCVSHSVAHVYVRFSDGYFSPHFNKQTKKRECNVRYSARNSVRRPHLLRIGSKHPRCCWTSLAVRSQHRWVGPIQHAHNASYCVGIVRKAVVLFPCRKQTALREGCCAQSKIGRPACRQQY